MLELITQLILALGPEIAIIYREHQAEAARRIRVEAMLKRKMQEALHDRRIK